MNLDVPGTLSAEIQRDPDGSSSVDLLIHEGASEDDATRAYRVFRDKLQTIYLGARLEPRTRPDGAEQVTFEPVSGASVRLVRRRRNDAFIVMMEITPRLY